MPDELSIAFHDDVTGVYPMYLIECPDGIDIRHLTAALSGIAGNPDFVVAPLDADGELIMPGGVGPKYAN